MTLPSGYFQDDPNAVSVPWSASSTGISWSGDLNGDGYGDLIVTGASYPPNGNQAQEGRVFFGSASGFYLVSPDVFPWTSMATVHPREIVSGDFNGDGRPDIFIASHGYDAPPFPGEQNRLYLSAPGGKWIDATATLPQLSDFSHSAAVGDVNGDGALDIYVGNVSANVPPYVLINDGHGHFTANYSVAPTNVNNASFTASLITDLDGDGRPDLVLGNSDIGPTKQSFVFWNTGSGYNDSSYSVIPPGMFADSNRIAVDVQSVDINGDGIKDIIQLSTQLDPYYDGWAIDIFLGDGAHGFTLATDHFIHPSDSFGGTVGQATGAGWAPFLTVEDVNNDGALDMIISSRSGGQSTAPYIYLNDGAGHLSPVTEGDISPANLVLYGATAVKSPDGVSFISAFSYNGQLTFNEAAALKPLGAVTADTFAPWVRLMGSGGLTASGTQTISGTVEAADAGTTVFLSDGTISLGTVKAGSNGSFSKTVTLSGDGLHTIVATDTDAAGNMGTSNAITFTLDMTAPLIVIAGVSNGTNLVDHTVSGVMGQADAGLTVTIRDGLTVLGTTVADAAGHWSLPFVYSDAGAGHAYALTASARDLAGNLGTSDTFAFNLNLVPNKTYFGISTTDPHSVGGEVYALYDGLLGRAPDALGLEYWADQFSHGVAPSVLATGFLASPEGQARSSDPDNGKFVDQLYNATLHRAGDRAGHDYWTAELNSGSESRGQVGAGFALSAEHLGNIQGALDAGLFVPGKAAADVARVYYAVLNRAPDADGLQFWTGNIKSGTPLDVMTNSFLSATEVQHATASLTTAQYVDRIYENALGRHAESDGLNFWVNKIDTQGAGRVSVTTTIGESAEAQNHHLSDIEAGWHLA